MCRYSVIAGICLLALASCGGPSEPQAATASTGGSQTSDAGDLSGQALTQAVVGRPLASKTIHGVAFTMKLDPSGTGTLTFSGKSAPMTWVVKGDILCFAATVDGQRQAECDRVRPAGAQYLFLDSTTGALNNAYTPL